MTTLFLMDAAPAMSNIQLDLETFGTSPGSAIRSIGACEFDPHGDQIGETFYANICDKSCEAAGLTRDQATVTWWSQQTQRAQDALLVDQQKLADVVQEFNQWFRKVRGIFVWSQGANFDQPLWEAAARSVGQPVPWKFWNSRCTRTVYDIASFDPKSVRRNGVHHNALDDAIYQSICVQKSYAKINGARS